MNKMKINAFAEAIKKFFSKDRLDLLNISFIYHHRNNKIKTNAINPNSTNNFEKKNEPSK
jgi:hypothetical protein